MGITTIEAMEAVASSDQTGVPRLVTPTNQTKMVTPTNQNEKKEGVDYPAW
jgi:hypothetical protein